MRIEITNVEQFIRDEIQTGAKQNDVAQTYALAMRSLYPPDWAAVNQMIIDRWSRAGLLRIKRLAHSGKCFK